MIGAAAPTVLGGQSSATLTAVRDLYIAPETADLGLTINMAVSRDGMIAVTQPLENSIRFFSSTGQALGTIGRAGAGPGEFRYVGYLLWTGDTLWVADRVLNRITLMSPPKQVLGTVPLLRAATYAPSRGIPPVEFTSPFPQARYSGGLMLFSAIQWDRARTEWLPPSYVRGEYPLLLVDQNGQVKKVLGFSPSGRSCSEGAITIPFCAEPHEAYAADGGRIAFATVEGSGGGKGTYRVVTLNHRGDTVFNRSYPFTPIPIPRAAIDSARARRVKGATGADARADAERMRIPTVYPPLRDLVVGRDGTVWVEIRSITAERRWQVLAPDGKPIGEVSLPSNVTLKVAQRDRIWALLESEDGEQGIASYAIRGGG